MLTLGIDSGSTTTKGVLFDGNQIVETMLLPTSAKPQESMERVYLALHSPSVDVTVTTGYGRDLLAQADKRVTEITCHGQGAAFLGGDIGGVIDIGGQDCKAILLDQDHHVTDFLMNDKCAAGTGRFMEVMMRTLDHPLEEIDDFVRDCTPIPISSMCTVFAESEMVSLLAKGELPGNIALGTIHSICKRTAFFAQKMKLEGDIFFTGGLSGSHIFKETLSFYLERPVHTHPLAQYAGAIGAAVIGHKKLPQNRK